MISQQNRQLKFLYLVYMVYWTVFSLIHKDLKSQKRSVLGFLQYYIFLSNRPTDCLYNTLTDSILTFTQHLHSINHYQIINHINSISLMRMKVPLLVHLYFSQMKKKNQYSHVKILCQKKKKIQMRWLAILLTCWRPLGNWASLRDQDPGYNMYACRKFLFSSMLYCNMKTGLKVYHCYVR